jgi:hypothetical protein
VDDTLQQLVEEAIARHQPDIVLLSVPFPGSVYAAFRIAQTIKARWPAIRTVLGGGFVNTELRELKEPRVFDYFDFITLDDGERPLLALLEHLQGKRSASRLVRTFVREDGQVRYINMMEADIPFAEVGTPTWDGLPIDRYLSLLDMLNPMHRLWSDGRWNKLTVAHGCYWKKCSFCDVTWTTSRATKPPRQHAGGPHRGHHCRNRPDRLPFCRRSRAAQDAARAGRRAAAPQCVHFLVGQYPLREILHARAVPVAGRQRLHRHFRRAGSGLGPPAQADEKRRVGGTGGARHASFTEAGVLVHAYLMYGFPTQTVQDTVDALEYVRQLFDTGCIQSGFFHRFACTVHSPVGQNRKNTASPCSRCRPSASPRTMSASSTPPAPTTTPWARR